jgi:hypothetical protein
MIKQVEYVESMYIVVYVSIFQHICVFDVEYRPSHIESQLLASPKSSGVCMGRPLLELKETSVG